MQGNTSYSIKLRCKDATCCHGDECYGTGDVVKRERGDGPVDLVVGYVDVVEIWLFLYGNEEVGMRWKGRIWKDMKEYGKRCIYTYIYVYMIYLFKAQEQTTYVDMEHV